MFVRTDEKIRFRVDSAARSPFYREVAPILISKFTDSSKVHLCDAGCGLGYLSLELAPHFKKITALDISASALEILGKEAAKRGLGNIEHRQADLLSDSSVEPGTYDAMLFSFFGTIDEILQIARPRCKNKLLILKKRDSAHRFSISHPLRSRVSTERALEELQEINLPCRFEDYAIEDGQPLRNLDDALAFFRLYSKGIDVDHVTKADIIPLLEERDDAVFPYYYPQENKFSLIEIDMSQYREKSK